MTTRWCACCAKAFETSPQVPRQTYCGDPDCQRERRRLWQAMRRLSDPDYLANQASAQEAWAKRNPGYSRSYRATHPEYVARNRAQQRLRNAKRGNGPIAKMDDCALPDGLYEMRRLGEGRIAKMDVWTVQLRVISRQSQVSARR